ncbi:MAG: tyrosine--tRNA ligase [Parcubacteria group bacterium QH_9_35_7]|nr:MAG: tyrosine--tRNA ligase [Parcubacteria group bacterium QH_9_35_7]
MVSTDPKKIKEVLERGVDTIYPNKEFLQEKLESGEKLSLYLGLDPTSDSLHIGHGIQLLKLKQFQELGHQVIFLIGDFTAMIGDPDQESAREMQSRAEVLEKCEDFKEQAGKILDFEGKNPVEIKYNSDWLGDMNFADVIDLSSKFTVQRMMNRDMFQQRKEEGNPIYVHEFMYPMMQAYDCVAMDVDGEIGGTDQTFNMLAGRDLMKKLKDKEKFVLTNKLLAPSGEKKMSMSEDNTIDFTDSPEDMYGKVMRWPDNMIAAAFELTTTIDMEELEDVKQELQEVNNPMPIKKRLAYEVTKTFLGSEAAETGQQHFEQVIQGGKKPDKVKELEPSDYNIITVLVESGFVDSKTQTRKLIDQGAVEINDNKIDSYDFEVEPGQTVQKGTRFFVEVK